MSGKGAIGWLILAVALAVPAFMFWNWWKLLNSRPAEAGRKSAGQVFPGVKNPLAASTATAVSPAGALPAVAASTAPATTGAVAAGAAQAPAPAAGKPNDPPPSPGPSASSGQAVPAASSGQGDAKAVSPGAGPGPAAPAPPAAPKAPEGPTVRFNPKLDRDPTLSPMDIKKLAQIALEQEWEKERLRKEAVERERRANYRPPPPKPIDIRTTIKLMGITAVPGSVTAIVAVGSDDGEIVRIGDKLRNGVQVIKMNPNVVWFKYKNIVWQRSVSKD